MNNEEIEKKLNDVISTIADYSSSPFSLISDFPVKEIEDMKRDFHARIIQYMEKLKNMSIAYGEKKAEKKHEVNAY